MNAGNMGARYWDDERDAGEEQVAEEQNDEEQPRRGGLKRRV